MTMLCTLIRGQMSYTFFQMGGTCPPMSIAWGQMSSYAFFHRGAHVPGGKCPTLVRDRRVQATKVRLYK